MSGKLEPVKSLCSASAPLQGQSSCPGDSSSKLVSTMLLALRFRYLTCAAVCWALLSGCNSESPVEELMTSYWGALGRGDVTAAYALLSSEDQVYISQAAFKARLRVQPDLSFLLALPKDAPVLAEQVTAEVTDVALERGRGRVLMDVRVPDLNPWLGEELARTLRGELTGETSSRLAAEKRLLQLHLPVKTPLPTVRTRYSFRVVKEPQGWRVTFPEWRAEAMLTRAKALSADKRPREAQELLDTLSSFSTDSDRSDPTTGASIAQEARRGRRMLPYLPRVQFAEFRRTGASPSCGEGATLKVQNTGDLPVAVVTGVVEFVDGDEPIGRQTVVLRRDNPVPPAASAEFSFCLRAPESWSGKANIWVSWLVFPEEVYRTRID